jgi:O-antigen ligase
MNREKLDSWCERGILGLVLAILVYAPLATGAVRVPDFLVIQGLTLGVVILWGARLWLNRRPKFLWPPICWAVLAFTIYAVARYLTADLEYIARGEMIRVLVYAILFFAIVNNLHRQESTQTIAFTLIFLAMAISCYAVYQFLSGSQKVWSFTTPYQHRGTGTFISPNNLAGFLELLLPLGLAYTLTGRAKPVKKVFLGYASLVMLAGIGVSVSRAGWLSTALALLVFFGVLAFRRSYRLPALALLLVIAGAGIYFIPRSIHFQARWQEVYKNGKLDKDARPDLWRSAVDMWQQHVLWGVGPAHFDYRFREFRPQSLQGRPNRVHNDYLNTLTDWGVAGFALVASAWALLAWGVVRTWRFVLRSERDLGSKRSNKFAFVLGASAGLVAILIHSIVDFNMHIPANAIVVVTLMALLSGHLRFATEQYWFTARLWAKLLASAVLAAGLVYLGYQEIHRARELVWLRRAEQKSNSAPEQAAALENAFAIEPKNFETAYAIGQVYQSQSWAGAGEYREQAEKAMRWFERGWKLNPFDPYNYLHYGMCLDWTGRRTESWPYYEKAVERDPNGYYMTAFVGWHYVQTGDYAAARTWFERSRRLEWSENTIADTYLPALNQKMLDAATNTSPFRLDLLPR